MRQCASSAEVYARVSTLHTLFLCVDEVDEFDAVLQWYWSKALGIGMLTEERSHGKHVNPVAHIALLAFCSCVACCIFAYKKQLLTLPRALCHSSLVAALAVAFAGCAPLVPFLHLLGRFQHDVAKQLWPAPAGAAAVMHSSAGTPPT